MKLFLPLNCSCKYLHNLKKYLTTQSLTLQEKEMPRSKRFHIRQYVIILLLRPPTNSVKCYRQYFIPTLARSGRDPQSYDHIEAKLRFFFSFCEFILKTMLSQYHCHIFFLYRYIIDPQATK